jgi:hypothetical protein
MRVKNRDLTTVNIVQSSLLKGVLSQLPGDTGHVRRAPCEDVSLVHEKTGEREFLFRVEVGPNDNFFGCIRQAEADLLYSWTWALN